MEQGALEFDFEELRERYRIERDKRVRADGNDQYLEVTGDFSRYVDDPYVEPGFQRNPVEKDFDVVIIGGGFGGMLAAARLVEAGIDNIALIEKGGDFGGTWYWNRYPGASCDIEAYVYLPMLEETGFVPKKKYTDAPETLEYCRVLAEKFALNERALMQTEVLSTQWDEGTRRWTVKTNRDDQIRAQFIVHSNGPLNRPKLPAIKGISTYKGHTFHTSRWDYDYTGGNAHGGLDRLHDKRIAIIGTGATAVQCVPHLGAAAKELFVFQRTPSSISVRNNQPTDPKWIEAQEPGWQYKRQVNFESLLTGAPVKEDLVRDGWTDAFRNIFGALRNHAPSKARIAGWALGGLFTRDMYRLGPKAYLTQKGMEYVDAARRIELADMANMEKIRARVDQVVKNKETAEALKPYYRQFCKRPCFHDEYLETFNRPNVHLVDTQGAGLDEFTEKGPVFGGREYEVDCIIFATGFEVGTDYSRRAGYSIVGVDGLTVSQKWSDGLATFHGMHVKGFPNCFFFGPAQAGFTATYTVSLDENSKHLAYILGEARRQGASRIEATQQAEDGWIQTIIEKARLTEDFQRSCTPGYYNNEGHVNVKPQNNTYGAGPIEFFELMKAWRDAGRLEGLELRRD